MEDHGDTSGERSRPPHPRHFLYGRQEALTALENLLKKQFNNDYNHHHDKKIESETSSKHPDPPDTTTLSTEVASMAPSAGEAARVSCSCLLVHGKSGTGKTTLCQQIPSLLEKPISENDGSKTNEPRYWFVQGKFDQYQDYSAPYSALVEAFEALTKQLYTELIALPRENEEADNPDPHKQWAKALLGRLQEFLSKEGSILTKLIPILTKLLPQVTIAPQNDDDRPTAPLHRDQRSTEDVSTWSLQAEQQPSEDEEQTGNSDNAGKSKNLSYRTTQQKSLSDSALACERLAVAFRTFLRILCTPQRPLILFVDDLQWTDENSLKVLAAMIAFDEENSTTSDDKDEDGQRTGKTQNFLLVGGYRDDEQSERLATFLDQLRSSNDGKVVSIHLENLPRDSVHELVQGALTPLAEADKDKLHPLVDYFAQKTTGNPYFVWQLLHILQNTGTTLSFNSETGYWSINLNEIQQKQEEGVSHEEVAYFVTQRIQALSPDVRRLLKLFACLGHSVSIELLQELNQMELEWYHQAKRDAEAIKARRPSLLERLQSLEAEHILPSPETGQNATIDSAFKLALERAQEEELIKLNGEILQFSHDRVQQCVYELIDPGETRNAMHHRIGQRVLKEYRRKSRQEDIGNEDHTQLLFLAADQYNRGYDHSRKECDKERLYLVELNLEAGLVAQRQAGVALVAGFLDKSIDLIEESDWDDDSLFQETYGLVLEVYTLSAEVESYRGQFQKSDLRADVILGKAKNSRDTVRAIASKAQSMGAQQQYQAAIEQARTALALLGIKVPQMSYLRLLAEIFKVRRMLKNKTEQHFLSLRQMVDPDMIIAMKILKMCVIWGWNCDIYLGNYAYIAMMKITLAHGRSHLTAYACAGMGNTVVNYLGRQTEGSWFAQLAELLDEDKDGVAATAMVVHCYLSHLRKPASASLEPLLSAYRTSLESGDLACGTIDLCVYNWVHKFVGLPLGPFVDDLQNYISELRICNQNFLLPFLLPELQFAQNLIGKTKDALDLSWEVIEEANPLAREHLSFLRQEQIAMENPADLLRRYNQLLLSMLLNDHSKTKKTMLSILARKRVYRRFDGSHVANLFFTLFDGLAAVCVLRTNPNQLKFQRLLRDSITSLTKLGSKGAINSVAFLHLLRAEKRSLKQGAPRMRVKASYDDAISQLYRSGFAHYCAMANERAGEYMMKQNDQFWAEHYLSRAATLFHGWGAHVKVNRLRLKYPFIAIDETYNGLIVTIRGKSRYDAKIDSVNASMRELTQSQKWDSGSSGLEPSSCFT